MSFKFDVKINFSLNSNKQGGDICYFKEKRFIRLMKRPRSTYYDCNRKPRSAKEYPHTMSDRKKK